MSTLSNLVKSLFSLLGEVVLTLCEGYEYEILYAYFLANWNFLDNFLGDNLWLAVAQLVDLSVQSVDLSLVAELSKLEVVSTPRVVELVNE